jgi:hypothetical protein
VRGLAKSAVGSIFSVGFTAVEEALAPFVDRRDLGPTIDALRAAGDSLQRGVVDVVFSLLSYDNGR